MCHAFLIWHPTLLGTTQSSDETQFDESIIHVRQEFEHPPTELSRTEAMHNRNLQTGLVKQIICQCTIAAIVSPCAV